MKRCIVAQQINNLPTILTKLALDSAAALSECARELSTSEAPSPAEFTCAVQEMPLMDIGRMEISLRGGILATRRFEAKLASEIGSTLSHTTLAYSGVLQRWTRATLKDLRERFDAYAEPYRARIAAVERENLQQHPARLRVEVPAQ